MSTYCFSIRQLFFSVAPLSAWQNCQFFFLTDSFIIGQTTFSVVVVVILILWNIVWNKCSLDVFQHLFCVCFITGRLEHCVVLGLFRLGISPLCLMSCTSLWMVELCGWSFQRTLTSAVGFVLRMEGFQPSLKFSRSMADSLT